MTTLESDINMSQAAVLRVGEVKGPAKAWLASLLGPTATDDAEVRISLKRAASSIPERKWTWNSTTAVAT